MLPDRRFQNYIPHGGSFSANHPSRWAARSSQRFSRQSSEAASSRSFDLPDAADVTQGFFSLRYVSTTSVMYSASRSLMARISDKVKGSGCWAQLTGQFAVEEMISVTCACRSMGVGRAMVLPPFYCRPPPESTNAGEPQKFSAASTDTKELRAVYGPQNNFDQRLQLCLFRTE